jgi:hypothetical protein
MRNRDLNRIFRALVVGLSAPIGGAAWIACGNTPDDPDADATAHDAQSEDATSLFGDVSPLDSYVLWCEAGGPQLFDPGNAPVSGCFDYIYVPCGLPPGTYVLDASADTGALNPLNRCDQICKFTERWECELTPDAAMIYYDGGVTTADGGPAPGAYVVCDCYGGGRRPTGLIARDSRVAEQASALARYFSAMAHLEAASVPAFARMRKELGDLGAPPRLLTSIERAIRDETRHARIMGRIARRFGGTAPVARVHTVRERSVEAIARENAVEGCVRETYGALVATWQAHHAADPTIRRAMSGIARDETRHAALSWQAARFLRGQLDGPAQRRVERARGRAIAALYEETSREPAREIVAAAGLPSSSHAHRLLDGMTQQLRIRRRRDDSPKGTQVWS